MKALVLAGGTGSRLRPITHTVPKQLIPLANKPVLDYVIEDLKSAGVSEIGIVIGGDHPDQIQSHLETGQHLNVDITYIMQGEPLGLAHAVGCAEDFVGDEPFIVYFGDTIFEIGLAEELVSAFDNSVHDVALALQQVDEPSRYGIAEFSDDSLRAIHEKPDDPPSDLAYTGVFILSSLAFDIISNQTPSWRGELEITETIDEIIKRGEGVSWMTYDGLWKDVGTPKDVIDTNKELIERSSGMDDIEPTDRSEGIYTGDGVDISDSATVTGPAIIGDHVEIGPNASIGPYTSISHGTTIQNATIESSVIMEKSSITCEQVIKESILGPSTKINNGESTYLQGVFGQDTNLSI